MNRLLLRVGVLALQVILLPTLFAQVQETDIKTAKKTQEEALKRSALMKPHFANGNRAMQDTQAIREQLQAATTNQKPALLTRMKADYQTAITEYVQSARGEQSEG